VTTVTIGYGAGLLAGFVAHIYVFGKAFGIKRHNRDFYLNLSRTTYGIICFGLLFSTLGTVLGGIWANDSWGRFWGWDPKENGALMIVLWELAILHAFAGGLIKRYGLNMAAIAGNIIVAFSWFGVNLLGVGLHSYGFTSGVQRTLLIFYGFESLVLLIGAIGWFRDYAESETCDEATTRPKRLKAVSSEKESR
jgi:ABC-type transport system involved in cytochrome c biogenesis permease subunit